MVLTTMQYSLGTYIKDLNKMVYLQNRRYLDQSSALRQDAVKFPEKFAENRPPPPMREYSKLKSCHEAYDNAAKK